MTDIIPAIGALDRKIPFEKWADAGAQLRMLQGEIRWRIGEWLVYGERHYGEDVYQVIDMWDEYSRSSLANMKYTYLAFAGERRRTGVSWSSHSEIRNLPTKEQEQWLDELEMGMTRAELRLSLDGSEPKEKHECPECGAVHVVSHTLEETRLSKAKPRPVVDKGKIG